jgi:hypothetical protein
MTAADEAAAAAAAAAARAVVPPPSIDPTTMTSKAILREVELLEASFERRIRSIENELAVRLKMREDIVVEQLAVRDERLSGIDEATKLRLAGIEGIPSQIDAKVGTLKAVMDEKFDSIATQFQERDTRSERESRDNKVAVDAAFAAQKEAAAKAEENGQKGIDKSEAATQETINKLSQLFQTNMGALAQSQTDIKDRLSEIDKGQQNAISGVEARLEKRISEVAAVANGYGQQKVGATDSRAIIGWVLGAIATLITIGVIAVDIATK